LKVSIIPTFGPAFSLPGLHLGNFSIPTHSISKTLLKDRSKWGWGKMKTAK
jgi:hypothetical protein